MNMKLSLFINLFHFCGVVQFHYFYSVFYLNYFLLKNCIQCITLLFSFKENFKIALLVITKHILERPEHHVLRSHYQCQWLKWRNLPTYILYLDLFIILIIYQLSYYFEIKWKLIIFLNYQEKKSYYPIRDKNQNQNQ